MTEAEQSIVPVEQTTREKVTQFLDQCEKNGQPIPSIRLLRAKLGTGSNTTVGDAIKQWRIARLAPIQALPVGFSADSVAAFTRSIWQIFAPLMHEREEQINRLADERIRIALEEEKAIRATTVEDLAEAEHKLKEAKKLQDQFAAMQAALIRSAEKCADLERQLAAAITANNA